MSAISSPPQLNSTQSRILTLLGSGVSPEQVASAVGVTASYVSQLMSDESFREQVTELRFENLQKHNERDAALDSLEDDLIKKLKSSMAFCVKPMEVLKAFQVVNAAKRRGQSTPESIIAQQNIVQINMPTQVIQKFTTNIQNQVVQAGAQNLETMQSGSLLKSVKGAQDDALKERVRQLTSRPEIPSGSKQEES